MTFDWRSRIVRIKFVISKNWQDGGGSNDRPVGVVVAIIVRVAVVAEVRVAVVVAVRVAVVAV